MRGVFTILTFCCFIAVSSAQSPYIQSFTGSSFGESSSLSMERKDSTPWTDPKKATVLALLIPGAGQIYNKRYWKAGIVYAGIGGLGYMFKMHKDSLSKYQRILVSKIDGDSTTVDLDPNATESSIKNDRDFHRRYRDIAILGFVGLYALQAIDANVDAHLKEFRINKDLSLKVSPDLYGYKPGIGFYNGMTVTLRF